MNDTKMDSRCPRKLKDLPTSWCPLAVLRLRFIRDYGRPLTSEEESNLPGCQWFISNQSSNYCFFKYMNDFGRDKQPSDAEIAHFLNISIEEVKVVLELAIDKVSCSRQIEEMRELFNGESPLLNKD